jgi:hypothetical protein
VLMMPRRQRPHGPSFRRVPPDGEGGSQRGPISSRSATSKNGPIADLDPQEGRPHSRPSSRNSIQSLSFISGPALWGECAFHPRSKFGGCRLAPYPVSELFVPITRWHGMMRDRAVASV